MRIHSYKSYISCIMLAAGLSSGILLFAAGTPTQIKVSSGSKQTATVGDNASAPFVAKVEDANGNAVSGARVDWALHSGSGSFKVAFTYTDSSGLASNSFTVGTVSGYDMATATIHGTERSALFGITADPGSAVTIGALSGNNQTGTVGHQLAASLDAVVKDKYGNTAGHTEVDWTVGEGGGSVPYPYSLSSGGTATKTLTLGTTPRQNTAVATIHGTGTSYTFTAEAVAGPVAKITIMSGNNQMGNANKSLPQGLSVEAQDAYGNPEIGQTLVWTPNTSGDSFSSPQTATDSAGKSGDSWKLGSTFGPHSATVSVKGTSVTQTLVATEGANTIVTFENNLPKNSTPFKPYFLGLSYTKSAISSNFFNADNTALVTLFKNLGPGVIRLNGDSPLDPVIWNHDGPGLKWGTISAVDIARFAAFLKAVNWKVLYGIAMIDNNASCAAGKTNCAADEAAVAAKDFGSNLYGFEFGNEPDIYDAPHYGDPKEPQIPGYTWADFISTSPVYSNGKLLPSWPAFASAVRAAVPNAPLTGPATGWDWIDPFAESNQASRLSLLTRHMYQGEYSSTLTMSTLMTQDPRVPVQMPAMAAAAADAGIPGGYRISECNTYAAYTPGVTNGFGAALWTIDFLFNNALYDSVGVNFNGGGDGNGTYSPIVDNGTKVTGIGPDYYGLFAYSLLVKGGQLLTTEVTPAPSNFSAYAVRETDGSTDLILNNKDPNNSLQVGMTAPNKLSEATSLLMAAPSLTATSGFQLGGSAIGISGSWNPTSNPDLPIYGDSAVVTVPAHSAQIIHLQ